MTHRAASPTSSSFKTVFISAPFLLGDAPSLPTARPLDTGMDRPTAGYRWRDASEAPGAGGVQPEGLARAGRRTGGQGRLPTDGLLRGPDPSGVRAGVLRTVGLPAGLHGPPGPAVRRADRPRLTDARGATRRRHASLSK